MTTAIKDPTKRHRHDVGEVAHGTESYDRLTRAIQALLGMWIVGSAAVLVYALVLAGLR